MKAFGIGPGWAGIFLVSAWAELSAQDGHGPVNLVVDSFMSTRLQGHFTAPPNTDLGMYGYLGYEVRVSDGGPVTEANWDAAQVAVPLYEDSSSSAGQQVNFDSGPGAVAIFDGTDNTSIALRYKYIGPPSYTPMIEAAEWSDVFTVVGNIDTTPPAEVGSPVVESSTSRSLRMTWIAPADDGLLAGGSISGYEIYCSAEAPAPGALAAWLAAPTTVLAWSPPAPVDPGVPQEFELGLLASGTTYTVAVSARDEKPNFSPYVLIVGATTTPPFDPEGLSDGSSASGCGGNAGGRGRPAFLVVAFILVTLQLRL